VVVIIHQARNRRSHAQVDHLRDDGVPLVHGDNPADGQPEIARLRATVRGYGLF
jgi:hypothetical protein